MYQYQFAPNSKYPYQRGDIYLGTDPQTGNDVGITTEVHAITIAGAGTGKGAAFIIPNLKRWPHNALVIDPKGEAAQLTATDRATMGQSVYVVDPFKAADVDDNLRASFNPLAALDVNSLTIGDDINIIADGIIIRPPDEKEPYWNDNAKIMISGLIAYALQHLPSEQQNLPEVRSILRDQNRLADAVDVMGEDSSVEGMMQSAYGAFCSKQHAQFLSSALTHTEWLDRQAMRNSLESSTFQLSELKHGSASVYLVLPSNYLSEHGRFLRLFVRCAFNEMAREEKGRIKGKQCLFLLDEFYSLGKIQSMEANLAQMRGYGLQICPILQDIKQLEKLYGEAGTAAFFSNADAHIFFGNRDAPSLEYVSSKIGKVTAHELSAPSEKTQRERSFLERMGDPIDGNITVNEKTRRKDQEHAIREDNIQRLEQFEKSVIGSPRLAPDVIREVVSKGNNDVVANSMIVFAKGGDVLNVKLSPYFFDKRTRKNSPLTNTSSRTQSEKDTKQSDLEMLGAWLMPVCIMFVFGQVFPTEWGFLIGAFILLGVSSYLPEKVSYLRNFISKFGNIATLVITGLLAFFLSKTANDFPSTIILISLAGIFGGIVMRGLVWLFK